MNLLATYNYQLADHKKPIAIFYIVIACLLALTMITAGVMVTNGVSVVVTDGSQSEPTGTFVGFEMTTIIFLFVVGLCTFKESFLMMVQNGISRKTLFVGKLITMATVAAFMAIVDKILLLLAQLLSTKVGGIQAMSLFEEIFHGRIANLSAVQIHLASTLFEFALALSTMAGGYFLAVLFYRLGKAGKVLVGAGVPVFLLIVLPILDSTFFNGAISKTMYKFATFMWESATHAISLSLVGFLLFSGLAYVLMRRAVVKE